MSWYSVHLTDTKVARRAPDTAVPPRTAALGEAVGVGHKSSTDAQVGPVESAATAKVVPDAKVAPKRDPLRASLVGDKVEAASLVGDKVEAASLVAKIDLASLVAKGKAAFGAKVNPGAKVDPAFP